MTTHPLGDVDGVQAAHDAVKGDVERSIADKVLNLDDFLSGEIRLAERSFRFCTRPDVQARVDDLEAEFESLTDAQGRPLAGFAGEQSVGGSERTAQTVAAELLEARREWWDAVVRVVVRQMNADDWQAWEAAHPESKGEPPYPPEVWETLIAACSVAPRFTIEEVRKFRARVGFPVYLALGQTAYAANVSSGVSLPKSPSSSAATRLSQLG